MSHSPSIIRPGDRYQMYLAYRLPTTTTTTTAQACDLTITKEHNARFMVGANGYFTIIVQNLGPGTSRGEIKVIDTLPEGLSYVSGNGPGWSCSAVGQTVTCRNTSTLVRDGMLPELTTTVQVSASASGSVDNTATVVNTSDANNSNNSSKDTVQFYTDKASRSMTTQCYGPNSPIIVTIQAVPSSATQAYTVEDTPPAGWVVGSISGGGSYDAPSGKVKWGLFFDNIARTLSYTATPPPAESGLKTFTGSVSLDGQSIRIDGVSTISPCSLHPADTNSDSRMVADEITLYGSAWKTGQSWSLPPTPIPLDYVARAGLLWRSGEAYRIDVNQPCPSCWVPNSSVLSSRPNELYVNPAVPRVLGTATRALPAIYAATVPISVSISVIPGASVILYAVEDIPPAGWIVSNISDGGAWDPTNKLVKWGLFFDNLPRRLTYQVVAPLGESGERAFAGTVNFNGDNSTVGGSQTIGSETRLYLPLIMKTAADFVHQMLRWFQVPYPG